MVGYCWPLKDTDVWSRYVTKGMCPLVPNSSKGDRNPYTITVTGPESSARNCLPAASGTSKRIQLNPKDLVLR